MNNSLSRIVLCLALSILLISSSSLSAPFLLDPVAKPAALAASATPDLSAALSKLEIDERYAESPLSFEANRGQSADDVQFLSRGAGYSLFLTSSEALLVLSDTHQSEAKDVVSTDVQSKSQAQTETPAGSVVRMRVVEGNQHTTAVGLEPLPGKSNYFIGDNPKHWQTDVPHYAKVKYPAVYPGIDLVYYGKQRQLEYDFIVAPSADPKQIRLTFSGAEDIQIDERGNLILSTAGGDLIQHKPIIYQEVGGKRQLISGGYVLKPSAPDSKPLSNTNQHVEVGFHLAAYDTTRSLIIDPVLSYATYLGGRGNDAAGDVAVDALGNAYVVGIAVSPDFPTTLGALDTVLDGFFDIFITKLNADGSGLIWSTYLGGSGTESASDIAIDKAGNIYLTGGPSRDFPTTPGAFNRRPEGIFVAKLNAGGNALLYSTFLGGNNIDESSSIALDSKENAYITGITGSTDFPITPGAFDNTCGSPCGAVFVTKFNTGGTGLLYSTYLGGEGSGGESIVVDTAGNAYITGFTFSPHFPTTPGAFDRTCNPNGQCDDFGNPDLFVTKLNATGTALLYSTYLGGDFIERNPKIAIDDTGHAYLTGDASSDFPLKNPLQTTFRGGFETFVTKLNPTGTGLVYSTLLGGGSVDFAADIAVDSAGSAYVMGNTESLDFPVTPNNLPKGNGGVYVTKFNAAGSGLVYSVILRDAGAGALALDRFNNVYIAGVTASPRFPTTPGAFDRTCGSDGKCEDPMDGETPPSSDAFVAKLSERLCMGRPITLLGTNRDDVLNGTPGPDVIDGLSGNDTINGRGGDDFICGGFGNDTLAGNDGNDRLHGGRGTDRLLGNAGNDLLLGKGGDDALDGGAGIDTCNGEGLGTDPADIGVDTAVRCENVDNIP